MKKVAFFLALVGVVFLYSCTNILKVLTTPSGGLTSTDIPRDRYSIADCIPYTADSEETKAKKSVYEKYLAMQKAENGKIIPSAMAGIIIHSFNQFQKGVTPSNALEQKLFSRYQDLSPAVKNNFKCSVNSFNELGNKAQEEFIPKEFLTGMPLSLNQMQALIATEVKARASLALFDEIGCLEDEQAGLYRPKEESGDDVGIIKDRPIIYKINGLRTVHHLPKVNGFSLSREEVENECSLVQQGGNIVPDCKVVVENCKGNVFTASTGIKMCMAVPKIEKGGSVLLSGANFYDTEGIVQLVSGANFKREVDAHVCGDLSITDEAIFEGVDDKLLFVVPQNIPLGTYGVYVKMPSKDRPDEDSYSHYVYIEVVASSNDEFTIATEYLKAIDETGRTNIGSDEVGIQITTVKFDEDFSISINGENELPLINFGDVDSGEQREMQNVLYNGGNAAVAIGVMGYEIDSRKAFEEEVEGFLDAFSFVMKDAASALFANAIGGAGGAIATLAGLSSGYAAAIAALVVVAINVVVAFWAPADLIVEDTMVFSKLDLGRLTSPLSMTVGEDYQSPGGVKVNINPIGTTIDQHIEDRTYRGPDRSTYQIRYRYNKTN